LWFQVAMGHALCVSIGDAVRDLCNQFRSSYRFQRTGFQSLCEALTFDETHREIVMAFCVPDIKDGDNGVMIKSGSSRRLVEKPLDLVR
ncbi:MAG: hypothetical protein AAF497_06250, partial [Planctomycetota bacterium]